jgi:hypothetical protein
MMGQNRPGRLFLASFHASVIRAGAYPCVEHFQVFHIVIKLFSLSLIVGQNRLVHLLLTSFSCYTSTYL